MNEPIIKVEGLSHRYSVQWAIRDINIEIARNGIYGLLGSNGEGKSTMMNIICGVLRQTQGDIFINGIDMRRDPVKAKQLIGFLPQKPPLLTDLTVGEYLLHCAKLHHVPATELRQAVNIVMERCGITHFAKRLIGNLSGGYQQRVGIAQAIVHNPDVVVLDEPTNGLDPNQILEVRKLIRDIGAERTVILSTHILSEVQATCSQIYMIEQGRMVFEGTIDEFDSYQTPSSFVVSMASMPSQDELMALQGVTGAEPIGTNRMRLRYDGTSEVMERIVAQSVAREWRLVEIYVEKSSLDAVFAELSQKN
jgi:ABC-2 type transport system ATP-binding protein